VSASSVTDLDADALSRAIHAREVSCREVMQAYLARIQRLNPHLNALVSLAPEATLLEQSDARDADLAPGKTAHGSRGWLHGMPQAIKDAAHAAGFPTTIGSPLLTDAVARIDGLMTSRMKAAGCIVIGKSNMPEFGLGSHTFNNVFGATLNAWDPTVSAGGSSGGAAVALAQRLLPVADGSDFMGSLRNPAAWNHVFGLRPSQGRIPYWPASDTWVSQLPLEGPMARNVRDLAKLLAVQAGYDARVPLSIAQGPQEFLAPQGGSAARGDSVLKGLKVGWLADLDGHLPLEAGLLPVCEQALQTFAQAGANVQRIALGFDPAAVWETWLVWRRALIASRLAPFVQAPGAREQIKPEALWEYDRGMDLRFIDFMHASQVRTAFYTHLLGLFESFDVLALPATQVWPFPIGERWPQQIDGRRMDTYHRWMEVTIYATLAGLPAISVPAGFHANGAWPAGLQLIGRPQGDAELLRIAAGYEAQIGELLARRPPEPSAAAGAKTATPK
jgi:amidase